MGLSCSRVEDLESNEYVKRFCSRERISANDHLWNNLFSHSLPLICSKDLGFLLDANVENLRAELFVNNVETRNFSSLVQVFTRRVGELNSSIQTCDSMFIWQTYNALFMIRNVVKYFAEYLRGEDFTKQFAAQVPSPANDGPLETADHVLTTNGNMATDIDVLEALLESVVQIITELPVKSNTYLLHLEAVNTMLVLLSAQMFSSVQASKLLPFRTIMQKESESYAPALMKSLLINYMDHRDPPTAVWQGNDSGSLVIGVASGIWNILRKGVGLERPKDALDALKEHNLGKQSLYLILVLINHCTAGIPNHPLNSYRESLVTFHTETDDDALTVGNPLFHLSYSKLYEIICKEIKSDDTTLLLYMLIHRNSSFKSYILARTDIEQMVLPILYTLYNAPTSTSHHIYMSLIVLLILSEDELFNQQVHDIVLKQVTWYTERSVHDISLGGLIILVVIRTIQYNILKMRDKYLHTNCLAALANMSSKFRSLHPYVSQRLLSLFETLAKRHSKLMATFNQQSEASNVPSESEKASETVQDINVLEEVIRMVLEILNSVLTHQLQQNRHLIYTLLYKRNIFDSFRNYDTTQDLVANIDIVIKYFSERMQSEHKDLSASEVMERVEDGLLHWSPDILRKFPDLKFRYVEEDQPEEFFIPYVWSIIYHRGGIHWSSLNICLFNAETEHTLSAEDC